jgi:hypothetical protein
MQNIECCNSLGVSFFLWPSLDPKDAMAWYSASKGIIVTTTT